MTVSDKDIRNVADDIAMDSRADSVSALGLLCIVVILGGSLSWPASAWPWLWCMFVPLAPTAMEVWMLITRVAPTHAVVVLVCSLAMVCSAVCTVFMALTYSETRHVWQLIVTVASFLTGMECMVVVWVESDARTTLETALREHNVAPVVRTNSWYTRNMDAKIVPWAARSGALIVLFTLLGLWMVAWPPWAWGGLGLPVTLAWCMTLRALPVGWMHVSVFTVCAVGLAGATAGAFVDAADCGSGREAACYIRTWRPWLCYAQAALLAVGLICVSMICSHAVALRNIQLALAVRRRREKTKTA